MLSSASTHPNYGSDTLVLFFLSCNAVYLLLQILKGIGTALLFFGL